ncbi:hypothetical protein M758_N000300 [Ceratodon purpureus]|nr:hypothetical protein M758_N000300 [Ceratodon purpureus]
MKPVVSIRTFDLNRHERILQFQVPSHSSMREGKRGNLHSSIRPSLLWRRGAFHLRKIGFQHPRSSTGEFDSALPHPRNLCSQPPECGGRRIPCLGGAKIAAVICFRRWRESLPPYLWTPIEGKKDQILLQQKPDHDHEFTYMYTVMSPIAQKAS